MTIDELKDIITTAIIKRQIGKDFAVFMLDCLEELKELRKQQSWISVEDRLPKDRRTVLVTAYWHETYQVMEASYYGDGLWWCVPFNNCGEHMQKLKPIAWMPLPSSYKMKQVKNKDS